MREGGGELFSKRVGIRVLLGEYQASPMGGDLGANALPVRIFTFSCWVSFAVGIRLWAGLTLPHPL